MIGFHGARQLYRRLDIVIPMAVDSEPDLLAHSLARGGYQHRHVFDLGMAEAAIVFVGFVRRRNIDVKLQDAEAAFDHLPRAPAVRRRRQMILPRGVPSVMLEAHLALPLLL